MEEKVKAFLELATQKKASDIFIIAGRPLSVKIDGKLCTLDGFEERLMPPETDEFIRDHLQACSRPEYRAYAGNR